MPSVETCLQGRWQGERWWSYIPRWNPLCCTSITAALVDDASCKNRGRCASTKHTSAPHSGMTDVVLTHAASSSPPRASSATNNINIEYEAAQYHLVFATHGPQCASPHGKQQINPSQRGGWHKEQGQPQTLATLCLQTEMWDTVSVRERRRNVLNEKATHRALYRGCRWGSMLCVTARRKNNGFRVISQKSVH